MASCQRAEATQLQRKNEVKKLTGKRKHGGSKCLAVEWKKKGIGGRNYREKDLFAVPANCDPYHQNWGIVADLESAHLED